MPASLYVVSTPIGNLEDITLRALSTLKAVGLIAAEDTRRTSILLRHFGITTPTTSLHEHNEHQKLPQLLQKLAEGQDIALVSDAGTPLVADPGQRLVAAAIKKRVRVIPIPGASSVLSALAVSGLPADTFVFAGFAPARSNERKLWLQGFADEQRPIVIFETPHRIQRTLADMPAILGDRPITIARELTKIHEEIITTTIYKVNDLNIRAKGEFTLVIGQSPPPDRSTAIVDDAKVAAFFYHLTNDDGVARRVALKQTALRFGLSTKDIYRTVESLKPPPTP